MSWRESRIAASWARAASPPDSDAVGWSSRRAARPSSAHTSPARCSRSAPPRPSQRSRAAEYSSSAPGMPSARAAVAACRAADAVGDTGSPRQRCAHRLLCAAGRHLRQVAHGGGRRRDDHGAGVERLQPRTRAEERRLSGAVRPDDAEPVAGGDHERHAVEDGGRAEADGQVAGDEGGEGGGGHSVTSFLSELVELDLGLVVHESEHGGTCARAERAGREDDGLGAQPAHVPGEAHGVDEGHAVVDP